MKKPVIIKLLKFVVKLLIYLVDKLEEQQIAEPVRN